MPHHALLLRPDAPGELWVCNDAGVYMSGDGGASWRKVGNNPDGRAMYFSPLAENSVLATTDAVPRTRSTSPGRLSIVSAPT